MTVRVAIADNQSLVRDGFRVQVGLAGDMEFAGEASTGEQAVALARREHPDVLLIDIRIPVLDGIEGPPSASPCTRRWAIGWQILTIARAGVGRAASGVNDVAQKRPRY